jgi:hypothetical protein
VGFGSVTAAGFLSPADGRVVGVEGLGQIENPLIGRNQDDPAAAKNADLEITGFSFIRFGVHG